MAYKPEAVSLLGPGPVELYLASDKAREGRVTEEEYQRMSHAERIDYCRRFKQPEDHRK
jgi:hypothetical protein